MDFLLFQDDSKILGSFGSVQQKGRTGSGRLCVTGVTPVDSVFALRIALQFFLQLIRIRDHKGQPLRHGFPAHLEGVGNIFDLRLARRLCGGFLIFDFRLVCRP